MKLLLALVALLGLVALSEAGLSMHNPFYCYATDWIRPQRQFHSVRTSYEAVRRTQVNPAVSSCTPAGFWYLGRHGGRNPETPVLETMFDLVESTLQADIAANYEAGRTTLCREDFELIQSWVRPANLTFETESLTTVSGWTAVQNIARRYQQFFPTLLPATHNPNWYHIEHSSFLSASLSVRGFVDGLFGDGAWASIEFPPIPSFEWFLRAPTNCPAYSEFQSRRERDAWAQGPEVQQMVLEVNRRLGFTGTNLLSFDQIFAMYDWCRWETASTFEISSSPIGENATWCAPFTVFHHELLEYWMDLADYYWFGYGVRNRRMTENLSCGLVQDLLRHVQGLNSQPAKIYYTTGAEVLALFVTFGVLEDQFPLHQFNFAQQSSRLYRTSIEVPNAGNIAVVVYECADSGDNDVLFLLNERPLQLPGCEANGICKASFLLERFSRFIDVNCQEFFCTSN